MGLTKGSIVESVFVIDISIGQRNKQDKIVRESKERITFMS